MRDFLNSILTFIGAESLTDEEFGSLEVSSPEYTNAVYVALKGILEERESVSDQVVRLGHMFMAKGVEVESVGNTPRSNIFIGSAL